MHSVHSFDSSIANHSCWVTVTNLPREANEAWLRMLFAPVGMVEKVDFGTAEGVGSAYILFTSPSQAHAALQYNGFSALGINLQVLPRSFSTHSNLDTDTLPLARRGPPMINPSLPRMRSNGTAMMDSVAPTHKNLYVLNLPLDATTDQLTALFSSYGTVVHCVILAMLDAQARRRGFIDMTTANEAKEAIEALNGFVWHGYPIEVSYAIVQRSGGPFDPSAGRNVIKRNVPRNRFNTGPRRIPSDVSLDAGLMNELAQQFSRQTSIGGMEMSGNGDYQAIHREQGPDTGASVVDPFTIFIAGLDTVAIIDDDDFRAALEPYGSITAATLCRDEKGISRGFGIVTFASEQSATNACDSINGKVIGGRRLTAHKYMYQPNGIQNKSALPITAATSLVGTSEPYWRRSLASSVSNPMAYAPSNGFNPSPASLQHVPFIPLRYGARPPLTSSPMWPASGVPSSYSPIGNFSSLGLPNGHEPWAGQQHLDGAASFFKPQSGNRAVEIKPDLSSTANTAKNEGQAKSALGDAFVHLPKVSPFLEPQSKTDEDSATGRNEGDTSRADDSDKDGSGNNSIEIVTHSGQPALTRTPMVQDSPWSQSSSNVSPNSLGLDGMSPQSTMSVSSSSSSASHLQTPEIVRNRDTADIWTHSQLGQSAKHESGGPLPNRWAGTPPTTTTTTAATAKKHANLSGSAILSLQSDVVDKNSRTAAMINLAPVGHEKTSSPMRVTNHASRESKTDV